MNILITGSSGFIGKSFLKKFPMYTVYSIYHNSFFSVKDTNIACDLSNESHLSLLKKYLFNKKIDILFHFAATTPFNRPSEKKDYSLDLIIAKHVSELCNDLSIKKIIYTSGWNVYDVDSDIPFTENTDCKPSTAYGQAKLGVEIYLKENIWKTQIVILRLSSVFGPGQSVPGLIPNFFHDALNEGVIKPNSIRTKRDYLYINDLMSALAKLINFSGPSVTVFNIGSGTSFSVLEIAEKIKYIIETQFNKKVDIEISKNITESTPLDNLMDISKANKVLNFYPETDFSAGLLSYSRWKQNKIFIIDLDGTLLDVRRRWYSIHQDLAEEFQYHPLEQENYINQKRNGIKENEIMLQTKITPQRIPAYIKRRVSLLESREYLQKDMLKSFASKILQNLSKQYTLLLVTKRNQKENCLEELRSLNIQKYFLETVVTESLSKIDIARHFLKKYTDNNFIVIGDTEDDLYLARHLGAPAILVKDGVRSEEYLKKIRPNILIDSLDGLESAIQNYNL